MTDLTLDDLAAPDEGNDGSTDTETTDDSGDGGEWVGRLFDRLDERGYLDAIIAQQFDVPMNDESNIDPDDSTDSENDSLDAGDVAQFGKLVIDNVGDVPMSQVVKYAENNPDVVDRLINKAMDGE